MPQEEDRHCILHILHLRMNWLVNFRFITSCERFTGSTEAFKSVVVSKRKAALLLYESRSEWSWYLQVCVWGWLVQTGKIQAELSSSLYAFWDLMMTLVHSRESGPDWAFPLSPERVRSSWHGADCAWTPETHWQLLRWRKNTFKDIKSLCFLCFHWLQSQDC